VSAADSPQPEETVYAGCTSCGHLEPRPEHAEDDWKPCERCGAKWPGSYSDPEEFEDYMEAQER
jgi:hypothetical protein